MKALFAKVVLVLVLFFAASRASVLSDALSAAFVDVVADDDLYSDCYSPYGLDIDPPDVSGCAEYPDQPTSGPLATVLQNKKIRFGISPFEPFSMPSANGTVWDGSEIKLAQKIANKLGAHYGVGAIAVEWVWMVEQTNFFDKLWGGLQQNKYEAVMSSVTVTAARGAIVDFGCSYFITYQGLLRGTREPTRNFTVIPNQLNSPTVKIGCLGGTTGMAWVDATLPNAEKHLYVNETVLVNAVKSGELHFAVSDKAILAYGLKVQHPPCPGCSLLDGDFGTGDHYGIFTMKDATPTPTPTPSPTPKPTPKPTPHDLKKGTIFSLITIGIFAAIILAGVGVGLYVHFNKKTEFIGGY